ncbi:MAG: TonB-dependent receptor, partial [Candidatus Omnitrophica bacterium]|nr:TonB-dependent receptor [Candidatus Omnitrophota bacterium]
SVRLDYNVDRNKVGPYVQDEITVFDCLKITAGLRYDYLEFHFDDKISGSNSKKRKMTNLTPKCGVVYSYYDNSNIYMNYAQAFRSPTIAQMFTYGSSSNPDLDPEKADNYEVGLRHDFNDKLTGNVSLYWMDLDNEIWYDYANSMYQNYGKTSHRGVEAGLFAALFENLTIFGNYAYTSAKNTAGDYDGKYLTNIPIHKGGFGVKVKTDYGFKAHIEVTMTGSSYMDSANEDTLKGYSVVDMGISYDKKWGTVFFDINNLFNNVYNSYGYKSTSGTKTYSPAPGIAFNYGVKVRF